MGEGVAEFSRVWVWGWGWYVPSGRRRAVEIGEAQGTDGETVGRCLGVYQKAVAEADEDSLSLAWEAAMRAVEKARWARKRLGAVYVGSESPPYAVKPTATMLGEALGLGNDYMAADLEFACKAATAGVVVVAAQVEAGLIRSGLVVGSDVAQAKAGDVLEFTAGAGAGALVLGGKRKGKKVRLVASYSYSSDMLDFWRRDGQKHPGHAGRFSGGPGYFAHVVGAARRFLEKLGKKVGEFEYVVLHMPNKKFPLRAAAQLGVTEKQLEPGLIVEEVGNPYSASTMIGLARVLEVAREGEEILVVSYGSGAGSDCLYLVRE